MKLTEERLKQIIKEEVSRLSEAELDLEELEEEAMSIVSKLDLEEQAIVRQFISMLKEDK